MGQGIRSRGWRCAPRNARRGLTVLVAALMAVALPPPVGAASASTGPTRVPPLSFSSSSGIDGDLGLPVVLEGDLRLDVNVPSGSTPVTNVDIMLPSSMRFESLTVRRIIRSGTVCDFDGQRITYRGSRTFRLSGFRCTDGADADDLAQFSIELEDLVVRPGAKARVGDSPVQATVTAGRSRWTVRGDDLIAIDAIEADARISDGSRIDGIIGRASVPGARTTLEGEFTVEVRQRTPQGSPIVSLAVDLPKGMTFVRATPALIPHDGDRCDTARMRVKATGSRTATLSGFSCSDRPGGDGTTSFDLELRDVVVRADGAVAGFDDVVATYRTKARAAWSVTGHGALRTRSTAGPAPRLVDVAATASGPVALGGEAVLRYEVDDPGRVTDVTVVLEDQRGRRLEASAQSPARTGTVRLRARESAELVAVTLTADDGLRSATYHADGSVTTDPVGLAAPSSHDLDLAAVIVDVERRAPQLRDIGLRSAVLGGVGSLIDIAVDAWDEHGIGRVELLYTSPDGPYRWITAGRVRRCLSPEGIVGAPGCVPQDVWEPSVTARVDAMWEPGRYRLDRIEVVAADGVRRASYGRDGQIKRDRGLIGPVHHDLDLRRLDFVLVDDGRFDTDLPRLRSMTMESRGPYRVGDQVRIRTWATDASGVRSVWLLYRSPSGENRVVIAQSGTLATAEVTQDWEPGTYRLMRATVVVGDWVQLGYYFRDGQVGSNMSSRRFAGPWDHDLDFSRYDLVIGAPSPTPPENPLAPVLRSIRLTSEGPYAPGDAYRVEFDAHAPFGVASVVVHLRGPGSDLIVYAVGDEACDETGCIEHDPWFGELVIPRTQHGGRYRVAYVSVQDWDGNRTTYDSDGSVARDRTYQIHGEPPVPPLAGGAWTHAFDLDALGLRVINPIREITPHAELRSLAPLTHGPYGIGDVVAARFEVFAERGVDQVVLHFQDPDGEDRAVRASGWRCEGEDCVLVTLEGIEFQIGEDWPLGEYRLLAVMVSGLHDRDRRYTRSGDGGIFEELSHGFDLSLLDFEVR